VVEISPQTHVRARVNQVDVDRTVRARTTLAELLRDELGLTGTKLSCGMQVCGVCTVLVDGRPTSACTALAADADGAHVRTVEGLAQPDGTLGVLQEAFVECLALQCGYCTPGFLMMATALLERNPDPSREEVVEHLDGNLCRCTGYEPIIRAVLLAARRLQEQGRG
jgi:aerobic-type carbon monoxide dehydrogenase small subunit (CoxS/CutS family)